MKNRRTEIEDDGEVRDGETVSVKMNMMDAAQQDVAEFYDAQTVVKDALARHNACAGHRPGYIEDAMTSRQNVNDVSYDLHSRTGTWWPEATKMRDEAYAATVRRQQWRDGPSPDNQNRNQSGQGEAMGRYSWTPEQMAVLKQACDILGITVPENSYAPFEDLYQRLTGLGPVGSMGGNPAGATRTGGIAEWQSERLTAALAGLRENLVDVRANEADAQRRVDYDKAAAERDRIAAELREFYPAAERRLAQLIAQLDANDHELTRINTQAMPRNGERLKSAELIARGLDGWKIGVNEVTRISTDLVWVRFEANPHDPYVWPVKRRY